MKLYKKITIFMVLMLLLVVTSIGMLSYDSMRKILKDSMEKDILRTANTIAMIPEVKELVGMPGEVDRLQNLIENIRLRNGVQFIVIMDMEGIRYSHPVEEKIGKKFEGGDEKRVLLLGESYVSEGSGSLGKSIRAFVPVYREGEQVGAACVGILINYVDSEIYSKLLSFIPFILVGICLGIIVAVMLSRNIKKKMFGLEPEEIAWMLKEKETVLQCVDEGIIAVDKNTNIILYNYVAAKIIGLTKEDIGKSIEDFIEEGLAKKVIKSRKPLRNTELHIRKGMDILCSFNPIIDENDNVMGLVASFKDLTEVKKTAEELTGIKNMAWSLRAQNHEFMNKLHTISGLIQLGEYDEAVEYISTVTRARNKVNSILINSIKDLSIAALLLAKYNKAEEARVKFIIDENSCISSQLAKTKTDDIISILGNLLDNSLDAVSNDGTGVIKVGIWEDVGNINIIVENNGRGIDEAIKDNLYKLGVSSKEGQRGCGMYIVKKIVDYSGGKISLEESSDKISWNITLPVERMNVND
jgi:two-component system, CitB family, sensor kinase